ncbi:hypothetical protein [Paenibacillus sp. L3-i20]|uniref:hypothetical protein n=1 Tax=Paenibacillus sp. L3-i20 TaxID=2905833 RepID=UPI001EDEE85F|nr:hypothetical protein [Paenibacillus sp. L3-i20]GKU76396.1 hypothetical protein L3i20_v207930 [Paenibacillus sp. L3-i20]
MGPIFLIIAVISLAIALFMFIGRVITDGLSKALERGNKSSKVILYSFIVYLVSFGGFIFVTNN